MLLVCNLECRDGAALARFWTAAAGYRVKAGSPKGRFTVLESVEPGNPEIVLQEVERPAAGPGRVRFELGVDGALEPEVARLQALGATVRAAPRQEAGHEYCVLADPEGNEFWMIHVLGH